MTGNVGRSGGGFSVYVGQYKVRVFTQPWWYPEEVKPPTLSTIYWVEGKTETMSELAPYPENGFKALFITFSNFLLQSPNLNKVYERLAEMELYVVVEHQMTETAKWPTSSCRRRRGTRRPTSRRPRSTRSCSSSRRRSTRSASRAPSSTSGPSSCAGSTREVAAAFEGQTEETAIEMMLAAVTTPAARPRA